MNEPAKTITDAVRRELWWLAGRRCSFPGCDQPLFEQGQTAERIYVGHECHIVAQKDDPRVARSPSSLTPAEQARWQHLIEDRHGVANLTPMCRTHSGLVDHPKSRYSVADVVEMKAAHEAQVARQDERSRSERFDDSPAAPPQVLLLDDTHEWERKSLKALAAHDEDELRWFVDQIGSPSGADAIARLVAAKPVRLTSGSRQLVVALTRAAERHGLWRESADLSIEAAQRTSGRDKADLLARAAISLETAGDDLGHDELLAMARREDPDALRVVLASLDQDGPVGSLRAALDATEPGPDDPPELAAQLHLHRTRASMLDDDLGAAEVHLARACAVDADGMATRAMAVNVTIQRGRVGIRDDRDVSAGDVRAAVDDALSVRDKLLEMRRFAESVRMLMLAADAWAILRDTRRARDVLGMARPEEIAAPDGSHVLGDEALRSGHADLALRFVAGDESPAGRRIAATARVDLALDRDEALEELETIAIEGGPEAVLAAAARLAACMPPVGAPFSEVCAQVLDGSPHARMSVGIRVLTLARAGRHEAAEKLVADLPKTTWAAELRLRAAGLRGAESVLRSAAENLLAHGPDPAGRLLAARALAQTGDRKRAASELLVVATQQSAPPMLRSDAYATVVRIHADGDDWPNAIAAYLDWVAWAARESDSARDERISAWQVRIAHHGGYGEPS